MICPNCKNQINDNLNECPICKNQLTNNVVDNNPQPINNPEIPVNNTPVNSTEQITNQQIPVNNPPSINNEPQQNLNVTPLLNNNQFVQNAQPVQPQPNINNQVNMVSQTPVPNQINNPAPIPTISNPKKPNIAVIIVIVVVIGALITSGIILVPKLLSSSSNEENSDSKKETSSSFNRSDLDTSEDLKAFPLPNSKNKYAIFLPSGEKTTDFVYDEISDIKNNLAIVEKDNEYGIISANGDLIVSLGKYNDIRRIGYTNVFLVSDSDYNRSLIGKDGNVLYKLENNYYSTPSYSGNMIIMNKDQEYYILDKDGGLITKIIKDENASTPSYDYKDNYSLLFYNNVNYIFDSEQKMKIGEIPYTEKMCIRNYTAQNEVVVANCYSSSEKKLNIIKNNNIYDVDNQCSEIKTYDKYLTCKTTTDEYLLDSNYAIDTNKKVNYHTYYEDINNYIVEEDNSVLFYNNNTLVKTLECSGVDDYQYGIVIIRGTYCSGKNDEYNKARAYNIKGELLFENKYRKIQILSSNRLALSEEYDKYYIAETTGKKLNETEYYYFYTYNDNDKYLECKKDYSTYCISNMDGEEIISDKDIYDISLIENADVAIIRNNNKKYILYDLVNKKNIIETESSISKSYTYEYIIVQKEGKYIVYNYYGDKIHEVTQG